MGYFFEHSCQKPEPSPIPQSSILGLRLALARINTSVPDSEKTKQSRLVFVTKRNDVVKTRICNPQLWPLRRTDWSLAQ